MRQHAGSLTDGATLAYDAPNRLESVHSFMQSGSRFNPRALSQRFGTHPTPSITGRAPVHNIVGGIINQSDRTGTRHARLICLRKMPAQALDQKPISTSPTEKDRASCPARPFLKLCEAINASRTGSSGALCAYQTSSARRHGCRGSGSLPLSVRRARTVHKVVTLSRYRDAQRPPDPKDRHL